MSNGYGQGGGGYGQGGYQNQRPQRITANGGLFNNQNMKNQKSPQLTGNIAMTPELLTDLVQKAQEAQQTGGELVLDVAGWWRANKQTGEQFISLSAHAYVKKPKQQGYMQNQPPQQYGQQQPPPYAGGQQPNYPPAGYPPQNQPPQYGPQGYPPQGHRPVAEPPAGHPASAGYQGEPSAPAGQQDFYDDDIPF